MADERFILIKLFELKEAHFTGVFFTGMFSALQRTSIVVTVQILSIYFLVPDLVYYSEIFYVTKRNRTQYFIYQVA